MAKPRKPGTAPADAPVRHEDTEEPVAPVLWHSPMTAVPIDADPINEGSAFIRELRCNLSAMGVTGEAQERAVAERWAARNR